MRSHPTLPGTARCATTSTMADARRGELWLIDLGEPLGREQGWQRPAVVVSTDLWNEHASVVTVLPLTRTRHGLPTRIELEPDGRNGLDAVSYARCEDIRSVSDARLVRRLGTADVVMMGSIGRVLRLLLEL